MDGDAAEDLAGRLARAGLATRRLRFGAEAAEAASLDDEGAAVDALSRLAEGPIWRLGPLDYAFAAADAPDDLLDALRMALDAFPGIEEAAAEALEAKNDAVDDGLVVLGAFAEGAFTPAGARRVVVEAALTEAAARLSDGALAERLSALEEKFSAEADAAATARAETARTLERIAAAAADPAAADAAARAAEAAADLTHGLEALAERIETAISAKAKSLAHRIDALEKDMQQAQAEADGRAAALVEMMREAAKPAGEAGLDEGIGRIEAALAALGERPADEDAEARMARIDEATARAETGLAALRDAFTAEAERRDARDAQEAAALEQVADASDRLAGGAEAQAAALGEAARRIGAVAETDRGPAAAEALAEAARQAGTAAAARSAEAAALAAAARAFAEALAALDAASPRAAKGLADDRPDDGERPAAVVATDDAETDAEEREEPEVPAEDAPEPASAGWSDVQADPPPPPPQSAENSWMDDLDAFEDERRADAEDDAPTRAAEPSA